MPTSRFQKALGVARGLKAFLKNPEDGGSAARVERGNGNRQRAPEDRERNREEPRLSTEEVRTVNREAGRTEQLDQVKRAKRRQQEMFQIKVERRAAREQADDLQTGALPDFVLVGAPKCGTTFLYHLLSKHPYVEPAACKEVRYFDLLFDEGVDWYSRCFLRPRWKDGRKTITGEATPSYLYQPGVPERMAEVVPRARLITLLRNPVDRTYSAYYHRARNGKETRTFRETIEAPLEDPDRQGYLSQAIYVDHLLRWSEFYDAEQMLVLKSEDFFERSREALQRVLAFLDLPEWEPEESELFDNQNKGGYEQAMDPDIRRRLEAYFEPHNRRLYDHLGVDFGW